MKVLEVVQVLQVVQVHIQAEPLRVVQVQEQVEQVQLCACHVPDICQMCVSNPVSLF